jgi:HTH-type transcriptional regulator/antitoxin HigA
MKTTENTVPFAATHAGEILLDEIQAAKISQSDLAKKIGYKTSQVNEVIKGKRGVNADLAILLEQALGIDAAYWLNVQSNYELDKARISEKAQKRIEAIKQWGFIKDKIAAKFLKKQKIVTGDPIVDIPTIKEVYGVKDFEGLANVAAQPLFARFKKSTALKIDTTNLIGWVKLVHYNAKQQVAQTFDYENKPQLISELKHIIKENKNTQERVKQTLSEYGIKLVYQEKGEKTPVDGVSFWSDGKPSIGMTLRHNRLDNFAFTLFHELGHVFEHLINNSNAEFLDLEKEYETSLEEKEANQFAQSHLINPENWKNYSLPGAFSDKSIIRFAEENEIHPSIVLGRICYEHNYYGISTTIDKKIY